MAAGFADVIVGMILISMGLWTFLVLSGDHVISSFFYAVVAFAWLFGAGLIINGFLMQYVEADLIKRK